MAGLQIWLVFWPGFFLGILHTLLPCEDKTIFFFYTFGTSRDTKSAFKIVTMYGFGLLCANVAIGAISAVAGGLIFTRIDPFINNGLGAISILVSGIIMLIQTRKKVFRAHYQQTGEIKETFQQNNGKIQKRTAYLLGLLAGLPPCVFELAIYSQAITFSASSGFINGVAVVFFYGIGTWLGLFPLAAFGLIGPMARNKIDKIQSTENNEEKKKQRVSLLKNNGMSPKFTYILEHVSAIVLISFGIIFLLLAIARINVFTWPEVPVI